VYKITTKGKEIINELLPDPSGSKVVDFNAFKNGNSPI